ncbi:hypothetical protein BDN67DRAFT_1042907 [Paxillus ammoniavirescens]|nr:hypothetical protein BDN67DRAFT_1042907 [Paxillus ammoniavirescens]
MDYDLPDMTPRRFLRHPSIKSYLQTRFPSTVNPALSDLHISLANRDHLQSYLRHAKRNAFPFGTGWQGLLNVKEIQDRTLPNHHHYIRLAVEVPQAELSGNCELDNEGDHDDTSTPLRVVICMLPQNSHRLQAARYLQSDIAFKRVAGFQEFELGGNDPKSNLTAAHQFIFRALEQIVEFDTGSKLTWQHLHATNLNDLMGILQWMGDQHGGQAKGLGLHLQWLAQQIPDHFDLHQPDCLLSTLDEYDHLRRVFRLCSVHIYRNIKTAHVKESVKNMMQSLVCMEHPDFTGTMEKIERDGGKPGVEGVHCSLVCGVKKGLQFDLMKSQSLKIFETTGIHPSFKSGHRIENITRGIRRKDTTRRRKPTAQDAKLKILNARLEKVKTSLDCAQSHARIEGHAI